MKIVITGKEMKSCASYIDALIGSMNLIALSVNYDKCKLKPRDTVKQLEAWINDKLGLTLIDKKAVTVRVVPVVGDITITVDEEFVVEFMEIYSDILRSVTPVVIETVKVVSKLKPIVQELDPKFQAFSGKWFQKNDCEEE